jgi:hypothetical protein
MENLVSLWKEFNETLYWGFLFKSIDDIQIWLKSDKNNNINLNFLDLKNLKQSCRGNKNPHFTADILSVNDAFTSRLQPV